MIELRSRDEIEAMRPAGRFVAAVLTELAERTRVGVNVLELDRIAHEMIREHRATSCYIDYHPSFGAMPFGKVLCVSVNDAVLHGLPHDRRLRDGDLVSLDFAAEVDGWVADSAITIPVGTPRDEDLRQIETAERALAAGIAAAQPGNRLGDISAAIGGVIRGAGYQVNTAFGGHGVGRAMHGPPDVPNDGVAGRGPRSAARARHRDRALVPRGQPEDRHRPRRLDDPIGGPVAGRPCRAHRGDHRRRTARPDRPRRGRRDCPGPRDRLTAPRAEPTSDAGRRRSWGARGSVARQRPLTQMPGESGVPASYPCG